MKRIVNLIMIVVLIFAGITTNNKLYYKAEELNSAEVVEIKDELFKLKLLEKVGKYPDEELTRADLESITELSFHYYLDYSCEVCDFPEIQQLVNLESLYLYFIPITNLANISSLPKLERLHLYSTDIESIEQLRGNMNLKELLVNYNIKLQDIDAIDSLINLNTLTIRNNGLITHWPSLSALTKLNSLDFEVNRDSKSVLENNINSSNINDLRLFFSYDIGGFDVNFLEKYLNISKLDIETQSKLDLSALAHLKKVEDFRFMGGYHSSIDLTLIKNYHELKALVLDYSMIKNEHYIPEFLNLKKCCGQAKL